MSSVQSTSNSQQAAIDKINGSGTTKTTDTVTEMQGNFLKLLMTQLKNQDPTNPMDNAQMTSQLAQMNTIRSIDALGATLDKLVTMFDATQSMQATSMLGKYVLVPGATMQLAQGTAMAGFELPANAEKITVTISDAAGRVVATEELGARTAGQQGFQWDGKDANGNALPDGKYKFKVDARDKDGNAVSATALRLGMVNAVVKNNGSFTLDLGELGSIALADVKRVM